MVTTETPFQQGRSPAARRDGDSGDLRVELKVAAGEVVQGSIGLAAQQEADGGRTYLDAVRVELVPPYAALQAAGVRQGPRCHGLPTAAGRP